MAVRSKKDKLIEDAQKLALRSQFDKAAKIYEQILESEPASVHLRQKLAELLIKCGRNDDARKELETIGSHFSKNGFYLKAIAVYKQLQKLFPADISLSLTLAELNEKHGLVANSLSEYKLVYEFHEKSGNISEALDILDRMQNVDPQSLPIKIKLAEAYIQRGKKDESYTVFGKAASLLLERGDKASLSKVCARVRQFFPDKPNFLLEILAEQVRRGDAASAIDNIQSLLRSDPNNKHAWNLIIEAYQQLGQPQRVKIAYQHYLKFFPSEHEAMSGLIQVVTAEKNIAGALELLDKYETALISAGFLQQLEQVYHALEKLDPGSTKVLEGLIRVATASGNEGELSSLTMKLQSLRAVSGDVQKGGTGTKSTPVFSDSQPSDISDSNKVPAFSASHPEQTAATDFGIPEAELSPTPDSGANHFDEAVDAAQHPEEEIEIDIEIDLDSPFGSLEEETNTTSVQDNWLDSVEDLFDSINTSPRVVKFGNEMENSDAQSHFDLGQAFKEMGLYDEAINEFRQASQDTSKRVECLIMQCVCLRERGEVEKAITMLLALLKPGLSEEESCAVKYELATGYEASGKIEEATILLNEINATNPAFRDISSRLDAANHSDSLDFSDDDLKDF